ncbi:MAG: 4Fe-4S dicluster domain-containing protein [Bacteroidales bacterium]|nr:4Fe-4S dicluster domain-containing protein [Bacteroidales bacterium]
MSYFENQQVKKSAYAIRQNYFNYMEKNLLGFETNAKKNGFEVDWADNDSRLAHAIESRLPRNNYRKVCFDIAEIPQSLSNDSTIKVISPKDFNEQKAMPDVFVTEADFAIAESGEIVLINKQLKNGFNHISNLIVILDISKLVVRRSDLDLMVAILAEAKNSHIIPDDVKILRKPFKQITSKDFITSDGPSYTQKDVRITVVLYDNGVSDIYENENIKESLYCIDCGLCAKACPVFAITQKYTPIQLVKLGLSPTKAERVSKNTTMCGNCESVCPVSIPLNELLLKNLSLGRNGSENTKLYKIFSKRSKMNSINHRLYRFWFLRKFFRKNKNLFNYFASIKEDFFNIQHQDK